MSTVTVEPCYIPVDPEATLPRTPAVDLQPATEKLALVIPTLRECESLQVLLEQVRTALGAISIPYEILIVDDNSCDGTEELVTTIGRDDPRVQLLVRRGERGLSGAILHGWQHTDATVLGVMDADLQHPPELLPQLVAAILSGNDLVIGSRYVRGGGLGEWNPIRKLISAAAVWSTWPLQRPTLRAHDPMSGFFFVRRHCVDEVMFQPTGFKLLLEILVRGRIRSVKEVPFAFGRRCAGCSKAGMKVAWDYFLLLVKLYSTRWRSGARVIEGAAAD